MKYTVEVNKDGTHWYKEGTYILHRLDGPAIEFADGYKEWYKDGQRHREDGPAVERANGYKEWCKDGKLHRLDGPAVEGINGYKEWWVDGVKVDEPGKVKELTVAEIEEKLGYSIKIVK